MQSRSQLVTQQAVPSMDRLWSTAGGGGQYCTGLQYSESQVQNKTDTTMPDSLLSRANSRYMEQSDFCPRIGFENENTSPEDDTFGNAGSQARRARFPKPVVSYLKAQYEVEPYPSETQKRVIRDTIRSTLNYPMTPHQMENWYVNYRRRGGAKSRDKITRTIGERASFELQCG